MMIFSKYKKKMHILWHILIASSNIKYFTRSIFESSVSCFEILKNIYKLTLTAVEPQLVIILDSKLSKLPCDISVII